MNECSFLAALLICSNPFLLTLATQQNSTSTQNSTVNHTTTSNFSVEVLQRLNELETAFNKSQSALETLHGFLKILQPPASGNSSSISCGDGINGTQWVLLGASTCITLLQGLYTFFNATIMCLNLFQPGQDIGKSSVVKVNSKLKATELYHFLQSNYSVSSVWVDSTDGISPSILNCTQLKVLRTNLSATDNPETGAADCTSLRNVVCEKTPSVPYASVIRNHLETIERLRQLEGRVNSTESQVKQLNETIKKQLVILEEKKVDQQSFEQLQNLTAKVKRLGEMLQTQNPSNETNDVQMKLKQLDERMNGTEQLVKEIRNKSLEMFETLNSNLKLSNLSSPNKNEPILPNLNETQTSKVLNDTKNLNTSKDTLEHQQNPYQLDASGFTFQIKEMQKVFEELKSSTEQKLAKLEEELNLYKNQTHANKTNNNVEHKSTELKNETVEDTGDETTPAKYSYELVDTTTEVSNVTKVDNEVQKMEVQVTESNTKEQGNQLSGVTPEGMRNFQVDKALGLWYFIKVFYIGRGSFISLNCAQETFTRTSDGLQCSRLYIRIGEKEPRPVSFPVTVDHNVPFIWRFPALKGVRAYVWMSTDYVNWGLRISCDGNNGENCNTLYILSRTRQLDSKTLDILQVFANGYGFSTNTGTLYDQATC